MRTLAAAILVAIARAQAENAGGQAVSARIVVSIPDRKLVVVEDGRVVKVYRPRWARRSAPAPPGPSPW